MAVNLQANASSSKIAASATSNLSAAFAQTGPISGGDGHNQKRSGGSGSFGAGATTRTTHIKQGSKNQQKGNRRYRYTHDEDVIAETAAMNSTRNRKGQTSITHLMNFALPPRPSNYHQFHTPRHTRRNPTWGLGSGYHAVDKARFVHANYRFIVDPDRDYHAQSIDADVYIDWNSILQVLVSPQSQASACPICLGDPVAPRMAKCGHIFCFHCLIRYMHSSDDAQAGFDKRARWKKCPICEDSIYVSETRPARWYIGQEGPPPRENEDVVLRLVMRPAGSTLALPRDTLPLGRDEEIPWHFAADVMDFARVMKGSAEYMTSQCDEELAQIEEVERHDELMFGEDNEWTSRAMRAVREAKEKARLLGNPPATALKPDEQKCRRKPAATETFSQDAPEMYVIQQTAKSGQPAHVMTSRDQDHRVMVADGIAGSNGSAGKPTQISQQHMQQQHGNNNNQSPSDYYFYQALLHHYLSALDIRILKAAFGEFSQFPSTILPRIEHVSTGHVVDEDLRRRTKYLSHLPHGCEVAFLECDWTDTVPPEILAAFKPEIDKRRKRNNEKEAREEKERLRAERAEDAKGYAAARRKRATSPSERFKPGDFEPLTAGDVSDAGGSFSLQSGLESTSPMWRQGGSGFASLGSPGTSPTSSRTVWGTTAVVPMSPDMLAQEPGPAPDDGWLQGWERDILAEVEEDLVDKTRAVSLQSSSSTPQSGGKKKKGKKITLMSTTVRRAA